MADKRILVVQNVADSGPGVLGVALRAAGCNIHIHEGWREPLALPDPAGFDGLVMLGGPQSAAGELSPHLADMLALMQDYHQRGRPILGICLGGQLLARALGGRVHGGDRGEFGFTPVQLTDQGAWTPEIAPGLRLMQWHDDSFTQPPGATNWLKSEICADQAFRLNNSIGLQCHPEVDADILAGWHELRRHAGDGAGADALAVQMPLHLPAAMAFGRDLGWRFAELVSSSS